MKHQSTLSWLILLIAILSMIAAGVGLFYQTPGQPFEFTSLRGETVMINGHGLYYYDSVSSATQQQAQDVVTVLITLPVLAFATWWAFKGSLRGQLLLTGTIGYFLYTYMSMSFLTAYNRLFLVYVAVFSMSVYAFIISILSIDLAGLPQRFSPKLPRKTIAGFLMATGAFLVLAWSGRIAPSLLDDVAPAGLESTTTLVIQAMDLGIIVPLAFVSGVLLIRGSTWGYLLSSVAVLKFLTYGVAVSAMGINQVLAGAEASPVELGVFPTLTLINIVLAVIILRSVDALEKVLKPA